MRSRWLPFSLVATLVLVCASPCLAQTWTAVGPPGGLHVQVLLPDPSVSSTIFAGTSGNGAFVSTDSGASWNASNNGLTSLSVSAFAAFQPSSPPGVPPVSPYVFAGTSDAGVFVSLSRGASWTAANNGLSNLSVSALAMSTTGVLYAGTQGGVFKSADNGSTWTAANSGLTNTFIRALAIDPSNASTLYAGADSLISKTVNGGTAWTTVFTPVGMRVQGIAIDPRTPSTVYAVGPQFPNPDLSAVLLKSSDAGSSWTSSANGLLQGGGGATTAIVVDPAATARLYVATDSAVFVSKNFGGTWNIFNNFLSSSATALTLAPTTPSTVFVGTAGNGIYRGVSDSVGVCVTSATALCLTNNRFRVEVAWSVPSQGTVGAGQAVSLSIDTGTFWFFSSTNYELMIKVLDARAVNGHIWVFYGALSNVQYTITVTDTLTGAVKTYTNPNGTLASVADTLAF